VESKQPMQDVEKPERLSVSDLERLRANYEAALKAGLWHKPVLTDEQRQVAAQLLADLALTAEKETIHGGES
jgi:hypothetical protein